VTSSLRIERKVEYFVVEIAAGKESRIIRCRALCQHGGKINNEILVC
jgi:hypothetical protein